VEQISYEEVKKEHTKSLPKRYNEQSPDIGIQSDKLLQRKAVKQVVDRDLERQYQLERD